MNKYQNLNSMAQTFLSLSNEGTACTHFPMSKEIQLPKLYYILFFSWYTMKTKALRCGNSMLKHSFSLQPFLRKFLIFWHLSFEGKIEIAIFSWKYSQWTRFFGKNLPFWACFAFDSKWMIQSCPFKENEEI